ncbi:hypothetical protein LCGC14_2024530 [marine sediment metagenome]|uniref:Uncharacterized protein n=1 Tax=marine sediment metagenome TaxID=412755 RepID=A0A0F9HTL6_9ZZZZ
MFVKKTNNEIRNILSSISPGPSAMHNAIAKLYRHIFSGGTLDQLEQDSMIILVLNPPVNKGVFERKSAGTLYARHLIYMNTLTGDLEIVMPAHWGNIRADELKESLDRLGANYI